MTKQSFPRGAFNSTNTSSSERVGVEWTTGRGLRVQNPLPLGLPAPDSGATRPHHRRGALCRAMPRRALSQGSLPVLGF